MKADENAVFRLASVIWQDRALTRASIEGKDDLIADTTSAFGGVKLGFRLLWPFQSTAISL